MKCVQKCRMGPFHGMDLPMVEASGGQEQYYMDGLIKYFMEIKYSLIIFL